MPIGGGPRRSSPDVGGPRTLASGLIVGGLVVAGGALVIFRPPGSKADTVG